MALVGSVKTRLLFLDNDSVLDNFYRYTGNFPAIQKKQLGGTKYIKFGFIPISVGIFLQLTGSVTAEVSVSLS